MFNTCTPQSVTCYISRQGGGRLSQVNRNWTAQQIPDLCPCSGWRSGPCYRRRPHFILSKRFWKSAQGYCLAGWMSGRCWEEGKVWLGEQHHSCFLHIFACSDVFLQRKQAYFSVICPKYGWMLRFSFAAFALIFIIKKSQSCISVASFSHSSKEKGCSSAEPIRNCM